METYATYKFWNSRGRRLSIFAIPEIGKKYTFTCSKSDKFSKKAAKQYLQYILQGDSSPIDALKLNPVIEDIRTDYTRNQFIDDCMVTHKKIYEVEIEGEFLSQSKTKQKGFYDIRQKFTTIKVLA